MKLNCKFVIKPIGDQFCASTENPNDFNGVLFFSEVGKFVFEELALDITRDELLQKVKTRYTGDATEIESEVDKFLNILTENNLLEV